MRPFLATLRSAATVGRVVRVLVVLGFALVVARHWHPYYGFTGFLQFDPLTAEVALPVVHEETIYVHPEPGSYDGGYYSQIATSPTLRDPALRTAIDDFGYRARRILLGAVAWVAGGGDPSRVMHVYAWLNVFLWFGFAALLWRALPAEGWRSTLAWTLLLLGAGALFSVRFALTDLAAAVLTVGAVLLVERGRDFPAAGLIGLCGLTRETGILGAAALLPATWRERRLGRLVLLGLVAVLPLALWLLYVRQVVGSSSAGLRNLDWPLAAWAQRWSELWTSREIIGNPRMQWESALEHVALTAQLVYLAWKPRWSCPWWRTGAAVAVLMVFLGPAVWGGFPNAASRVLLPLTIAFNVLLVRHRARLAWFLAGNLSVFAGVHTMDIPSLEMAHMLPAPGTWQRGYLFETDQRWSVAEWNSKRRWAWCADSGGLTFRTWPAQPEIKLEVSLCGRTPRSLEVLHGGRVIWSGPVGSKPQWVPLPVLPLRRGRLELEVRSDTPAVAEGADNTARRIGIACFGVRVAE
jgi:hypothetical protein